MKHHSFERHVVIVFAKNIFLASFCQKKRICDFFRNRFDIPYCPMCFVNLTLFFVQKYMEDPFAYFLAALTTSKLTGAEIFDSRKSSDEFLAKIIENPDFFTR